MTYCLGIKVEEGLIGIADTRILAGHDCRIAKKTWVWQDGERSMFIMTSGLRSLRDKVLTNFEEALEMLETPFERLFRAVNLFTSQVRRAGEEDRKALEEAGLRFNIHALIGGQFPGDREHKLYLAYPEGNWVEIGRETPFEIIGASGYGKPILERSLHYSDSLLYAFKLGCLSFDSTQICAADVDYPIDVLLYSRGSFQIIEHRYEKEDLREISQWWQERLRRSVLELPSEKIERAFAKLALPLDARSQ
jgi:putative proteasome-type protease